MGAARDPRRATAAICFLLASKHEWDDRDQCVGGALLQSQPALPLAGRFAGPQLSGGLQRCSGGGPAGGGNEADEGTERRDRSDAAPRSPLKPAQPPSQNKTQPTRSNLAAPNSLSHNRATERSQILCGIKFYQRLSRCQRRSH